jgi:hypothetical protein
MSRREEGAPHWRAALAEECGEGVVTSLLGREGPGVDAAPRPKAAGHLEVDDVLDALGGLVREGHVVPRDVAHRLVEEAEDRDAARRAARRRAGHWREGVGGATAAAMLGGRG